MPAAPRERRVLDQLLLTLLALAAALLFLSGPFVGWAAFLRVRRLEAELAALRAALGPAPVPGETAPAAPAAGEASTPPPAAIEGGAEPAAAAAVPPIEPPGAAAEAEAGPARRAELEGRLAERWLVWLGGLALVLGALFLAAWAVEAGLLGPRARVGLAWLVGIGLLVLAEQAYRRRPAEPGAVDLVPAALAAGAVTALYGAALAAHLLYGLVPPAVAFVLLASSAALAVALALRYGALLAALGAAGAFAVPLLVAGDEPAPWALALYLGGVLAALAAVAALRRWAWLGWLALLGSGAWAALLLATGPLLDAPGAGGLLLAAQGLAGLGLLAAGSRDRSPLRWPGGTLLVVATLLELGLMLASDHAAGAVASLALLALAAVAVALAVPAQRWVAALLAGATLLAAGSLSIPWSAEITSQLHDPSVALEPAFWLAPEARGVAAATALVGALWALLGGWALVRAPHPGFWAALSGFAPLVALALAYARLEGFEASPPFAALGLGLALLATLAAQRVAARPGAATALAAYAIAAAGAVGLALAMALAEAWLTVALALEVAAIAWVARRLALAALRRPAAVLVLIVLARVLPAGVLADPEAGWPVVVYGHGLPLLALVAAAIWLRAVPAPPVEGLEEVLQAVATLLWLLLLTRLLATLAGADSAADLVRFPTLTASMLGWLLTAVVLWRLGGAPGGRVLRWLGHLVAGLGAVQLAVLALPANPVLTGAPVGPWPLVNLLLPAYLAPALGAAWVASRAGGGPGLPPAALRRPAAVAAVALGLLWLTLEVRRAFQGTVLAGSTSQGEWLAWSAAWLGFAALLLALGVRRRARWLGAAALAVAALAILKAFLFDLSELEGLYRAVSFLGLGLCLVGVGFLYRRYVAGGPATA